MSVPCRFSRIPPVVSGGGSRGRQFLFGCCALAALFPAVSAAQTADGSPARGEGLEEIIITGDGSQVRLPEAYAGGQVARGGRVGIFGNLDMMDAPFTSTNYTAELMLDQQATSVADVLQNDPVVRPARGFGNFQEVYVIRGFPVFSDDMTYNGLYGILPRQFVAAELLERVEVFRGANTFLNGAAPGGSGVGGAFNLVPKRAPDAPLTRVTAGFENDGQLFGALDVGRRFGPDGNTGVRVNAVRRDGETAIEGQDRALSVIGVGLDYEGDRLRLSADTGFQDHHIDAPRPSVTPLGAIPRPPEAGANFAQPWTYTDERQFFGVVRGEYDLTANITAWAAAGMRDGRENNMLANPSAMADGTATANRFDNLRKDRVYSGDVGLRGEFATGGIGHRLTVSASAFSLESRNAYAMSGPVPVGSIYGLDTVAPPEITLAGGSFNDPLVTEETDTKSIAVADMLSVLDEQVLLIVGARYQDIATKGFTYDSGALQSEYDENKLTPMAGLVVKPVERISVYGNYIQSLIPGEVAPEMSGSTPVVNAGEVFAPYTADQFELGVKYDGGDFGGGIAAFTLARPSAFVEDGVFSVAGEQRNRGIELTAFGQPLETVRLIGGLTLLDAEMTRTLGGQYDGNKAVGAPDMQINANIEWDIPALPGVTLDGRVVHTAGQYADQANSRRVSSWTRFDMGARYETRLAGYTVTLRARLDNVTDKNYWASVGGYPGSNYLVLGAPRTFLASASLDI